MYLSYPNPVVHAYESVGRIMHVLKMCLSCNSSCIELIAWWYIVFNDTTDRLGIVFSVDDRVKTTTRQILCHD